jgi:hypothetical protein
VKSLLVVTINNPQSAVSHCFVISKPCAQPDIPAGHWTQTSIAHDIGGKKCVLLKESWQILLENIEPKGVVYERLHHHSVPNIPDCFLLGDVGNTIYHATCTHNFAEKYWQHSPTPQLVPHQHYRLVLDTIG